MIESVAQRARPRKVSPGGEGSLVEFRLGHVYTGQLSDSLQKKKKEKNRLELTWSNDKEICAKRLQQCWTTLWLK